MIQVAGMIKVISQSGIGIRTIASRLRSPIILMLGCNIALGFGFPSLGLAASEVRNSTCPQDIQSLTTLMLRDLPGYANRVMQRSRRLGLGSSNSYVVVAGNPDFTPINTDINPSFGSGTQGDIATQRLSDDATQRLNDRELQQVFFTTLNREYQGSRLVEVQEFHRLFLVNTSQGWQLTLMYSRSGSVGSQSPQAPTPVRESLNSAVGQAVSTWLRDCQAGTIRGSYL